MLQTKLSQQVAFSAMESKEAELSSETTVDVSEVSTVAAEPESESIPRSDFFGWYEDEPKLTKDSYGLGLDHQNQVAGVNADKDQFQDDPFFVDPEPEQEEPKQKSRTSVSNPEF